MREILIQDTIKDVLGPRNGPTEEIDGDLLKEFITGVIVPRVSTGKDIKDPDAELIQSNSEDMSADDDAGDDVIISSAPSELDPKSRPASFGISFLTVSERPSFKVCATWGRYSWDEGKNVWTREPYHTIVDVEMDKAVNVLKLYEGADGKVRLQARRLPRGENEQIIILTMVNELVMDESKKAEQYNRPMIEASLFQPSLRVNLDEGTMLEPLQRSHLSTLHFLYRKKPALARGYMCSAIWKEIDYHGIIDGSVLWPDGEHFTECSAFRSPDVRSEFVPLSPIPAPVFEWDETRYGKGPMLSTRELSEIWTEEEIEVALSPFVRGYRKWIEENEQQLQHFEGDERDVAERILKTQKDTLTRLSAAIKLLKDEPEVRLCFCFANRTIWKQNQWKRPDKDFLWRPFQLAFFIMNLEPIVNTGSDYRDAMDLLWIPTGGGKTEAYLAIMAFTMAFRRRTVRLAKDGERTGAGTALITRYTLRLLTVQQFRRTLGMVTAAESLRVHSTARGAGWRPEKSAVEGDWIYGTTRFSTGLWVGSKVSPNHLRTKGGAIEALNEHKAESEPAQVMRCPCCSSWLAVPKDGLPLGKKWLHVVARTDVPVQELRSRAKVIIDKSEVVKELAFTSDNHTAGHVTVSISLKEDKRFKQEDVDALWGGLEKDLNAATVPFRASRCGYFPVYEKNDRTTGKQKDFELYCTDPSCKLNTDLVHVEGVPGNIEGDEDKKLPDGLVVKKNAHPFTPGSRIPIPAYTVDEQVYHHCPTIIISTADKIARISFEPKAAAIFGNVDGFSPEYGYVRQELYPKEAKKRLLKEIVPVPPFAPPSLIVQDELHLIEGPLGGMFGLYECVVEGLVELMGPKPKYIASTATIKNADEQVRQLFARSLFQFPAYGLEISDSFFVRARERDDGWNEDIPGRVYLGLYTPSLGKLTPIIRTWANLLKTANDHKDDTYIKHFWTVVGYFNALREIGGARALYREDILERLKHISKGSPRILDQDKVVELSSRIDSTDIPQILSELETAGDRSIHENPDAIFTTSMFGTGVDVPHLSLMVVNSQPKTTSQYIQATGRVGRSHGGLIITLFRAGRARDLSHYEMFSTYHQRIYIEVEPISVSPFSEGALERASGPALVGYARNRYGALVPEFMSNDGMSILDPNAGNDLKPFIQDSLPARLKAITGQSEEARYVIDYFKSQREMWEALARNLRGKGLAFNEYAVYGLPKKNVVLGDPPHGHAEALEVVFENAPQSLREVEETTSFGV